MTIRTELANLLKGQAVGKMKAFSLSGQALNGKVYNVLGEAIEKGVFNVSDAGNTDGAGAVYDTGTNTFEFKWSVLDRLTRRALAVHEATHAITDLLKTEIKILDGEGLAYVFQCQYAQQFANPGERLMSTTASKDKVFEVAWDIATTLRASYPNHSQIQELRKAIKAHPNYITTHDDDMKNDGV